MTKKYRDFENARKFARSLHLKNWKEWQTFSKTNRPNNIPSTPSRVYAEKGWISAGDFLGTRNVATSLRKYRDFENARKFARSLHLKNWKEWREFCKSGNRPDDIPTHPNEVYKKEWSDVGDFLGTKNVALQYKTYRNFKDARKFARSLHLKNYEEWREFCKSGFKPDDIPANPQRVYIDKGWVNLKDWLNNKKPF